MHDVTDVPAVGESKMPRTFHRLLTIDGKDWYVTADAITCIGPGSMANSAVIYLTDDDVLEIPNVEPTELLDKFEITPEGMPEDDDGGDTKTT